MKTDINQEAPIYRMLYEITASLQHLEQYYEKNQVNFNSLIEAKAKHNVEIEHLSSNMEKIFSELKNIDSRLARVETIMETERSQTTRTNKNTLALRLDFFETIREYWHIIALLAAIASCALSYFFGIHIKD